MRKLIISILLFFSITTLSAQSKVSGYVFEDSNNNQKKERSEKGIKGVAVSNSVEVVLTDDKGYYELPLSDHCMVFVIKPEGYMTPVNENNLPQFFYMHKPNGSPKGLKYEGSSPTGKLPKSVDFPLVANKESSEFKFFAFGDPQPYSLKEVEYFDRGILKYARQEKGVSFGISLGDVAGDNLDLHAPYNEVMRSMNMPWYNVMGNHDRNQDVTDDKYSSERFEATYGPANYVFKYGKAHFMILDDIIGPNPETGKDYIGGFREDQLMFIENYLNLIDKDELIFVSYHIPLAHLPNAFVEKDRHRFFELFKGHNVVGLSAHTHKQSQFFWDQKDGWYGEKPFYEYNVGTTNGDWYSGEFDQHGVPISTMRDGTPKGYAIISVSNNKFVVDYIVAGKPRDYQMELYCPKVIANYRNTSSSLYVNFFMGSLDDVVEYRIDGGKWNKMEIADCYDPSYMALLHKWDCSDELLAGKRSSRPQVPNHLWIAPLNPRLEIGEHIVEVRATDIFGQVHKAKTSYRIAEKITTPSR